MNQKTASIVALFVIPAFLLGALFGSRGNQTTDEEPELPRKTVTFPDLPPLGEDVEEEEPAPVVIEEPKPPAIPDRVSTGEEGCFVSDSYATHEELVRLVRVGDHFGDSRLIREGRVSIIHSRQVGTVLEVRGDAWKVAFPETTGWVWSVYLEH